MINWTLIRNPWNWAIILLMVIIGGFAVDAFTDFYTSKSA
jgi:hypothetical protein